MLTFFFSCRPLGLVWFRRMTPALRLSAADPLLETASEITRSALTQHAAEDVLSCCLVGRWRREMKSLSVDCLDLKHDLLPVAYSKVPAHSSACICRAISRRRRLLGSESVGSFVFTGACQASDGVLMIGRLRRELR